MGNRWPWRWGAAPAGGMWSGGAPRGASRLPLPGGRVLDAPGHRRRGAVVEAGPAALRSSPTGVPGAGGSQLWHRRVDRRDGVVRARRLPALLALGTGGAPQRVGRQRRLLRPASGPWLPDPAGTADVAVGAVRSSDERVAPAQPRPRLLHDGQEPARRQARRHRRRPSARSALLPRSAQPRSRRRLRDGELTTAGDGGRDRPRRHHGSPPRSAPATGVPASLRAGRPSNTDATALPAHDGGHPITIVVADDTTFVEHLGNAGRPHAAINRPIASLHRPSGWSRSFVLASLRALHLDQRLRSGALRAKRALTAGPHTGNAGSRAHKI